MGKRREYVNSNNVVSHTADIDASNAGSSGITITNYTFYDANGDAVTDSSAVRAYIDANPSVEWYGDNTWSYTNFQYVDSDPRKVEPKKNEIPLNTDSGVASIKVRDFSIKTILGGNYEKCPELLYEPTIDSSNIAIFEGFQNEAYGKISNIDSLCNSIKQCLVATNSNRFTVAEKISILDNTSANATSFSSKLNNLEASSIQSVINEYNTKLKQAKKETRKYLLQKQADEINNKNIIVEQKSYSVKTFYPAPVQYKDGIFKIVREAKSNGSSSGSQFMYDYQVNEITTYYIKYDNSTSISILEDRIERTGHALPYNKGKIKDYEE